MLDLNKVEYKELMLDELYGEDQVEIANCIYGQDRRFVPFVYLGGKALGSFGELYKLHQARQVRSAAGLGDIN